DESASGRPADVLVMPDGALLVADDAAGAVYRVTYAATAASN
ncbi:MAG: sorbosone dehydrogenase family protein, partial [Rhodanobacteraceae bacterium]